MNTHVKVVAALHIVMGALGLIGAMVVFAGSVIAGGITLAEGEGEAATVIVFVAIFLIGLIVVLSLPSIVGGWALLAGKSWGRVLMIILGFLDLLNVPFGTALGIYTLWVMLREEQSRQP